MMKKGGVRGKLSYGVGAVGLDLSYGLFYNYLAKYLTDVLLLKNNFLLFLTPIARIWDGVNDPMMGTIVGSSPHLMHLLNFDKSLPQFVQN